MEVLDAQFELARMYARIGDKVSYVLSVFVRGCVIFVASFLFPILRYSFLGRFSRRTAAPFSLVYVVVLFSESESLYHTRAVSADPTSLDLASRPVELFRNADASDRKWADRVTATPITTSKSRGRQHMNALRLLHALRLA